MQRRLVLTTLLAASIATACTFTPVERTAPLARPATPTKTDKAALRPETCPTQAYPASSLLETRTGTGLIEVRLSAEAKVLGTRILKTTGSPELDETARSVLQRCSYLATQETGTPIADTMTIEFTWSFKGGPSLSFEAK